jgi:CheY-like chemotaxis protein
VLDYRLPDGNGVEAAEALLARNARIRLLFLSGYVAELQAGLRHGPAATAAQLAKPVDAERLLAWVAEALGRGSAERPRR